MSLLQDLERFNEWWTNKTIRTTLAQPFHRKPYKRLEESLQERQILIVTGLRRVGKTTLLYQTIQTLLKTTPPKNIMYFSFEETTTNPKEVLSQYENAILQKPLEEADKIYIFFDEIQNIKEWPSNIKQFYDLYPNLKFYLSGSSSLLLSKEATQKLAGRFFIQEVKPLTFTEFLSMQGIELNNSEIYSRKMKTHFQDYLKKSGFPEIINWTNEDRIAEYIKNSIIDRITLRDIPSIFKTRDITLMENLLKLILTNPGCIINLNSLSRTWGANKITISNYLRFLETSLLIHSLSNYKPSFLASSRKLKKYYPTTPSLIYAQSRGQFKVEMGKVLETYAVNALNAQYYFREGKREIDIILKNQDLLPIEVKESVGEEDIARFANLVKYLQLPRGVIISTDQRNSQGNIDVIPAYLTETLQEK